MGFDRGSNKHSIAANGGGDMARRASVLLLLTMILAACGIGDATVAPTASGPTPMATASTSCGNGVDQATCTEAAQAALAAVADSGHTATQVWVYSGELSPIPEQLFDPAANFPAPQPPAGGSWIGSVEIAFVDSDEHAGLNIARTSSGLVAVLVGYRIPAPDWCSGVCP
jgi:hypothetical protein